MYIYKDTTHQIFSECPPAIVSTYLGDDITKYLESFKDGTTSGEYKPAVKTLDLGTKEILPFEVPAEDRNRTSPLPYGGARFEFRAGTFYRTLIVTVFSHFNSLGFLTINVFLIDLLKCISRLFSELFNGKHCS